MKKWERQQYGNNLRQMNRIQISSLGTGKWLCTGLITANYTGFFTLLTPYMAKIAILSLNENKIKNPTRLSSSVQLFRPYLDVTFFSPFLSAKPKTLSSRFSNFVTIFLPSDSQQKTVVNQAGKTRVFSRASLRVSTVFWASILFIVNVTVFE